MDAAKHGSFLNSRLDVMAGTENLLGYGYDPWCRSGAERCGPSRRRHPDTAEEGLAMENSCPTCSRHIEDSWRFCPGCGTVRASNVVREHEEAEPEAAPTKSAYSGLLLGLIAMPILLIVGIMLCLTGLGAILGVPMIIAAILAPLAGPMFGLGALAGECPWCGIAVSSVANLNDFNCHGCGKRIAIRHRHFTSVTS